MDLLFSNNFASLAKYGLPTLTMNVRNESIDKLLMKELDYNTEELSAEHESLFAKLNDEQKEIYHVVLRSVADNEGIFFFVYGHGGTKRTSLWKTIIRALKGSTRIVLAVALSGIASLSLPRGQTTHSRFKIPINVDSLSICEIKKGTELARLLQNIDLIL